MNNNPFRPEQPQIPGVKSKAEAPASPDVSSAENSLAEKNSVRPKSSLMPMPPLWVILSASTVLVICAIAVWWMHGTSAKETSGGSEAVVAAAAPATSSPASAVGRLPVGPGEIATTSELAKPWSSKKFLYQDPITSQQVPAMVVHLPGGVYWGFSLREPFGTCEMEFVTDLDRLRSEYNFRGSHPMVADPCNHAVFDLTKYGSGPSGLVRGEIAQGAAVRPPMAIEIQVRGKQVLAKKIE